MPWEICNSRGNPITGCLPNLRELFQAQRDSFTRSLPNHWEIYESRNNPITGYLPNRRELFQSQLDPFTLHLPNHWEIFDSRSNPITGYLPHLRGTFQTISDPFAGYLPKTWVIFNSRSNPTTGYLPHLREHLPAEIRCNTYLLSRPTPWTLDLMSSKPLDHGTQLPMDFGSSELVIWTQATNFLNRGTIRSQDAFPISGKCFNQYSILSQDTYPIAG